MTSDNKTVDQHNRTFRLVLPRISIDYNSLISTRMHEQEDFVASNTFRNYCRVANKADILMELNNHNKMYYYIKRTWRNKVINDDRSHTHDDYIYYYIHPFGRLGRLHGKITMAHIRSSSIGVDYFLHEDMEQLLQIYENLSSQNLTQLDGSPLTSWEDFDNLCGGRDNARDFYNMKFSVS